MVGKRDGYWNNPKDRVEHLKYIQEEIRNRKPTKWVCVCGNEAKENVYNNFDADGWTGVVTCSICRRNMSRKEVK
ncbi:MAG: hypothetical protein ACXABY_21205 [Candidatus Thorarchaeota archaeon]